MKTKLTEILSANRIVQKYKRIRLSKMKKE
jgi:hypothetical protein